MNSVTISAPELPTNGQVFQFRNPSRHALNTIKAICHQRISPIIPLLLRPSADLAPRQLLSGPRLCTIKRRIHHRQSIRRNAILNPLDQRLQIVPRLRAGTSAAMADSGSFEDAVKVLHAGDFGHDPLVVVFGAVGEDQLVGEAVPGDDLAAVGFEEAEVGVGGADDTGELVPRVV